jgi:hypothetical protein
MKGPKEMWAFIKQHMFLVFVGLIALNMMVVSAVLMFLVQDYAKDRIAGYETISCGDAKGVTHKCIRIDPQAGELNNAQTGASYRVIFGQ